MFRYPRIPRMKVVYKVFINLFWNFREWDTVVRTSSEQRRLGAFCVVYGPGNGGVGAIRPTDLRGRPTVPDNIPVNIDHSSSVKLITSPPKYSQSPVSLVVSSPILNMMVRLEKGWVQN